MKKAVMMIAGLAAILVATQGRAQDTGTFDGSKKSAERGNGAISNVLAGFAETAKGVPAASAQPADQDYAPGVLSLTLKAERFMGQNPEETERNVAEFFKNFPYKPTGPLHDFNTHHWIDFVFPAGTPANVIADVLRRLAAKPEISEAKVDMVYPTATVYSVRFSKPLYRKAILEKVLAEFKSFSPQAAFQIIRGMPEKELPPFLFVTISGVPMGHEKEEAKRLKNDFPAEIERASVDARVRGQD